MTRPKPKPRKKGLWYGLIVFPEGYKWRGTKHAASVLDAINANPSEYLVAWSRNRAEMVARSQKPDLQDRVTDVIELDWDSSRFQIRFAYQPDTESQVSALRAVLRCDNPNCRNTRLPGEARIAWQGRHGVYCSAECADLMEGRARL